MRKLVLILTLLLSGLMATTALSAKSLFSSDYVDRETGPIGSIPQELVKPNENYLTISITSARIDKDRRLFSKYHGAVYSFFKFDHYQAGTSEMASLTLPTKLQALDKDGVNNIIQMKDVVLGPVPYRGGKVEMEIGLLAVKYDDVAEKFIGFINKVGEQAGAPKFFASSVPILSLIKTGIESISGTESARSMRIGIAQDLWEENLKTGSYFASNAKKGEIDSSRLTIDADDGRLLLDGEQLIGVSYFVFTISATKQRNDIASIPELLAGYKKIQDAIREFRLDDADKALGQYYYLLAASPDLIPGDGNRLWRNAKAEYDKAIKIINQELSQLKGHGGGAYVRGTEMRDFGDIAAYE